MWGQCSDVMREKLESLDAFDRIKQDFDVLKLLKEIKVINFKFEDQKYPYGSVYFANKRFYNYKQSPEDTNNQHYDKFNNLVSVVESYGGLLGHESMLLEHDSEYKQLGDTQKKLREHIDKAKARNKEKFLSFCLIAKADQNRYGNLKTELENDFTKGDDRYPKTLSKALHLLTNYKREKTNGKSYSSVSFGQKGKNNNNNRNNQNDDWQKVLK